ncbi:MAG: phosphate/phosphite/phosphonate ABC transporter substrate-binding protein [Myxococcales bacterium]|nr:phosphate/phosphite/phosphonate ABC transporter substrate-binding protein [Myxococcales bacterium]
MIFPEAPSRRRILTGLAGLIGLASVGFACDRGERKTPAGGGEAQGAAERSPAAASRWPRDGSPEKPLQVMLIPADGGTEDGTKSDFLPLFNAISRVQGLHFNVGVGQSYGAVVEAMANGQIDVGFFGPVSYLQAKKRAGAELLAVSVENGASTYLAGIFVAADAPMHTLADLKGKSLAVGDPGSASSFAFPLAMLLEAGVDPVKDLAKILFAGSHVNSLAACAQGHVDAGAASFLSFEKAVTERKIAPDRLRPLAKSDPIPNPPLAMHPGLDPEVKRKLRDGFGGLQRSGIPAEQIRGYGGRKVERYDVDFPDAEFMKAAQRLEKVEAIKDAVLKKAGQN